MVKILAVDDSKLMNAVITNFVKKLHKDYEVIVAGSGEEAIQKYMDERPDLVFLDIKMPGMDGLTALEKIRQFDPGAIVVMCTALKEPEQEERARKAGAKMYIRKPFGSEDIDKALKLLDGGR